MAQRSAAAPSVCLSCLVCLPCCCCCCLTGLLLAPSMRAFCSAMAMLQLDGRTQCEARAPCAAGPARPARAPRAKAVVPVSFGSRGAPAPVVP